MRKKKMWVRRHIRVFSTGHTATLRGHLSLNWVWLSSPFLDAILDLIHYFCQSHKLQQQQQQKEFRCGKRENTTREERERERNRKTEMREKNRNWIFSLLYLRHKTNFSLSFHYSRWVDGCWLQFYSTYVRPLNLSLSFPLTWSLNVKVVDSTPPNKKPQANSSLKPHLMSGEREKEKENIYKKEREREAITQIVYSFLLLFLLPHQRHIIKSIKLKVA